MQIFAYYHGIPPKEALARLSYTEDRYRKLAAQARSEAMKGRLGRISSVAGIVAKIISEETASALNNDGIMAKCQDAGINILPSTLVGYLGVIKRSVANIPASALNAY